MATTQLGTFRRDLDLLINENEFILQRLNANDLAPNVPVTQVSASQPVLERGETLKVSDSTRRNYDGTANRTTFQTKDKSYFTEPFISESELDRIQTLVDAQYWNAQVIAAQIAKTQLLIGREQRVAAQFEDTAAYTAFNAGSTFSAAAAWDDETNADPYADIITATEQLFNIAGLQRQQLTVCIDTTMVNDVMKSNALLDRPQYTINMDTNSPNANAAYLKEFLGVNELIIRDGVYNTAGINGTPNFVRVWDRNKIQVFYKVRGNTMGAGGFCRQPVYTSFAKDTKIDQYVEEAAQKIIFRAQEFRGISTDYQFGVEITGVET